MLITVRAERVKPSKTAAILCVSVINFSKRIIRLPS